MQFAHPNILYALILLGIPILIHLFQLRRFTPEAFTNVAMLKRIEKQSRKSHSILQWLLLLTRLLLYACIIFAFAQPYFPKNVDVVKNEEVILYLDNYLSLDAPMGKSNLLHQVKTDIQALDNLPSQISWFTNTDVYYDHTPNQFKETVQKLSLTPISRTPNEIQLQVEQLANRYPEKNFKLIWISDFHRLTENDFDGFSNIPIKAYSIQPDNLQNTSIDTLYIEPDKPELSIEIYHKGEPAETTVSLYNKESILGRQKIQLTDSTTKKISFALTEERIEQGKVQITDPNIAFDNEKFFSLMPQEPIKIKALGKGENSFLKVFESKEFQLEKIDENANDLSGLENANLIVLYNIERLTPQLSSLLENSIENAAFILLIPSENMHIDSYNTLLQRLNAPQFTMKKTHQRRLSTIHYDHPVLQGVFERRVENFQNPYIKQYFGLQNNGSPILSYDTEEAFLTQAGSVFLFTASLEEENTNFIKSPLIVPALYNIAMQSQPQKQLYQLIGKNTTYVIPGDFVAQDILHITDSKENFIPIQEHKRNGIWITTNERPLKDGNYKITKDENTLNWISYNYPNLSKDIQYPDISNWNSVLQINNIELPNNEKSLNEDSHTLWKWFVIFALLFLGIEILLLKYYR